MRELLNQATVRTMAAIAAAVAAICLAVSVAVLVPTVQGQQERLAHQSTELECRGDLAAESDVLRNEIALWLSRGLRAVAVDDQHGLDTAIENLARLDRQVDQVNARREQTVRLCQED